MGRHSSGQARVTIAGKVHYLGAYGSAEALDSYNDLVQRWTRGEELSPELPHGGQVLLTVHGLFDQYREWILRTQRYVKNGAPTSQRHLIEDVLVAFEAFAGGLRATRLSEAVLMQWRDRLEESARLTRRGINRKLTLLLSVLKWARSRALIPRTVWADCSSLESLKRGECGNRREHVRERRAVTMADVEKVAAACTCRHVAAMLRVQALLGCRPGEVAALRWVDIDKTPVVVDGVSMWTYRVPTATAKTAHHGRKISYPVPPAAQAILAEFDGVLPAARIFSPEASMKERGRARKTAPTFGEAWTARAYRNAVTRACEAAGVPYFCPHEIRHGAITRAAEVHGLLAAQRLANHSSAATTARYLHTDDDAAYRIAARIG